MQPRPFVRNWKEVQNRRRMEGTSLSRAGLSSTENEESEGTNGYDSLYMSVHENLNEHFNNNCMLAELEKAAENEQTCSNNKVEVRLICLWKLIEYCVRKGDHKSAEDKLNEYHNTLALPACSPTELDQFEATELYLRCLVERSKGNYEKSYEIANESLKKIVKLLPGIVSTEFYVLAAAVVNILAAKTEDVSKRELLLNEAKKLFDNALCHLEYVHASKDVKADIEHKIYTNLTIFHSSSCLAGYKITDSNTSIRDETKARIYLDRIHSIVIHENIPLSAYRETQHHLAQSDLFYLASKSEETRKNETRQLKHALKLAKQAESEAEFSNFPEMKSYAQNRVELLQDEAGPRTDKQTEDMFLPRKELSSAKKNSEPWKWKKTSLAHRVKFTELLKIGQEKPEEVMEINRVRVCCLSEFCIGKGDDGTRVYIGLGKDGIERAVKRLQKDRCASLAEHEKEMFNEPNVNQASNVVRYYNLDDECDKNFVYLILGLCEETLEDYVDRETLDHLKQVAPEIIRQLLNGLAELHGKTTSVLHRDLKPASILRHVNGNWLLADFGISRILTAETNTHKSKQRGTLGWRAVETYPKGESKDHQVCSQIESDIQVRYKKESDIQVAGMVAYYVVTKGKHPFGGEADRLRNLLDGNPVGVDSLPDPAFKDLVSWMLSHDPNNRPSAEEALKHAYLQTAEEKFEMLCEVGNQVDIKTKEAKSYVAQQLNEEDSTDWRTMINGDVLKYLFAHSKSGKPLKYGSSWTECLRLIRDLNQHWKEKTLLLTPPEAFYEVGDDPQKFFLGVFPNLPVMVHRIVRKSDWKKDPKLQKFFS